MFMGKGLFIDEIRKNKNFDNNLVNEDGETNLFHRNEDIEMFDDFIKIVRGQYDVLFCDCLDQEYCLRLIDDISY